MSEGATSERLSTTSTTSPDEPAIDKVFARLKWRIALQTWIIAVLTIGLIIAVLFASPIYLYYAVNPQKQYLRLVGLEVPNMTNRAVLSWATTAITEIMTMGFGDMDIKLPSEKWRFTPSGWDSYIKAFIVDKIGQTFKQNQLVLTTVPSNTPVILSQGVNPENVYEWLVQMPVIMTYATNNNVTSKKQGIVTLEIVRVNADINPTGVAIKSWHLE